MVQPISISMKVVDEKGASGTQQFWIPATTLPADQIAVASALSNVYDAALGARVAQIVIRARPNLGGSVKAAPVAGVFINVGGLLAFDAIDTQFRETFWLPGIREDAIVDKDSINPDQAQVLALRNALINGLTVNGNLVAFTDAYGNDLTSFLSSSRTDRSA